MARTIHDEERGRIYDADTGQIVGELPVHEPEPEGFRMLSVYGDDQGELVDDGVDWLGTLSAGFKNAKGYPEVSRDGTMYLSGSNPERYARLAGMLAETGGKKVTIALTSDSLEDVIHQRYVLYSSTRLVCSGDLLKMVPREPIADADGKPVLDKEGNPVLERHEYMYGTPEYSFWRKRCRPEWSIFFVVAAWKGPRALLRFPDGFGQYRLRTGSPHSVRNAIGKLSEIGRLTGGRLRGIPLDLQLGYRDVAGPDGVRRRIPVFEFGLQPPDMIELDSGNFRSIIGGALAEGAKLLIGLPSPSPEAWERADDADLAPLEPEFGAPSEADIARAQRPDVAADPRAVEASWFAMVDGSALDSDQARAAFIAEYSQTRTSSLAEFLETATAAEADALLVAAMKVVVAERRAGRGAGPQDDPPPTPTDPTRITPPPPTPIDAPVITLPAAASAVADPPPTVADAVAPPPERPAPQPRPGRPPRSADPPPADPAAHPALAVSAARTELDADWGRTWRRAENAGIKDFTRTSELTDDELRQRTVDLKKRVNEKERNDGSVDARDFEGAPDTSPEGPTLPMGI